VYQGYREQTEIARDADDVDFTPFEVAQDHPLLCQSTRRVTSCYSTQ